MDYFCQRRWRVKGIDRDFPEETRAKFIDQKVETSHD
jgi:hypothetical protein